MVRNSENANIICSERLGYVQRGWSDYLFGIRFGWLFQKPIRQLDGSFTVSLFDKALALVLENNNASVAFLQRALRIGYAFVAD
jgi:DNA segregation ATPase FtsK/SpoIIIE-like protein